MGDFNMPPGVSVRDIPGYWDDEPPIYRCSWCGGFLRQQPDEMVITHTRFWCDGKIHSADWEYDESTIRIIGEEFRDKTYRVEWVQCEQDIGENVREHEPHWFDAFYEDMLTCYRRKCSHCGKKTEVWE